MERHVYKFEFKYDRQVNGKKTEFTVPVIVHNECYMDACTKVDEFVRKNFADRVTEESTIKYVGEFVHGVLKPFMEMKEEKQMKTYLEMYDEMVGVHKKVELLENRVEKFEKENDKLKPEFEGGWFDPSNLMYNIKNGKNYNFIVGNRGSWKKEFEKQRLMLNGFMYTDNTLDDIIEKIKNTQPQVFDVNSMYPQMVDVCKVYQIERDQALKENEVLQERIDWISADSEKVYENLRFTDMENDRLLIEVSGYKKELSQLNLLMDDMENRLEKQVVAREGMLKQLREYKAEKKRMNKIIDALTEDK